MNKLLAWMEENQADGEMAMVHFLKEYPAVWQGWLSESQTSQVLQALKRL